MTVQCSEYKDCGNPECMHAKLHKPIKRTVGDCTNTWMICPLVKPLVRCYSTEDNTVKVKRELVAVPA